MDLSCLVTPTCHFAGQSRDLYAKNTKKAPQPRQKQSLYAIVPPSREERIACVKLGLASAAVLAGTPAIMSALHLIGVW